MQDNEWLRILEPALHAQIAVRCHRAYRHDIRNGLQGIYGGFDALSRMLQAPARDAAKIERTTDFVRQAVTGHEKSLDRLLHGVAPLDQEPATFDASLLLAELVKFLTNDAAAHRVSLRNAATQSVMVRMRAHRLRLALLSLMIDAIDAMPGGGTLQLGCGIVDGAIRLELSDTRTAAAPGDVWALDLSTTPPYRGWTGFVARQIVIAEGGHIACKLAPAGGRSIHIGVPAAPVA